MNQKIDAPEAAPPVAARQTGTHRYLGGIAAGLACALASLGYRLTRPPSTVPLEMVQGVFLADYGFALGTAIALVALYTLGARRGWRWPRLLCPSALILPLGLLAGAVVYKLGMYQFGGWDEGMIVHVATYYAHGLRPFADFPCSMPPSFMAGIRLAALLFGLRCGPPSFFCSRSLPPLRCYGRSCSYACPTFRQIGP